MGLDCYVRVDPIKEDGSKTSEEIWYGRKENEIHGWMQRHSPYPPEEFNCVDLPLTTELLDSLEKDLTGERLPPTAGFFFGGANHTEDVVSAVGDLLTAARNAITEGRCPYYSSWW